MKYEVTLQMNVEYYPKEKQILAMFRDGQDAVQFAKKLMKTVAKDSNPVIQIIEIETSNVFNEYTYQQA